MNHDPKHKKKTQNNNEKLVCARQGRVIYYGQPVALVLHPDLGMAQELATYLRANGVSYEQEHAVLTLNQAVAEKSFLPAAGDPGAGMLVSCQMSRHVPMTSGHLRAEDCLNCCLYFQTLSLPSWAVGWLPAGCPCTCRHQTHKNKMWKAIKNIGAQEFQGTANIAVQLSKGGRKRTPGNRVITSEIMTLISLASL